MSKILVINNGDKRFTYMIEHLIKKHDIQVINDELTLFYALSKKEFDCLVLPIRGINNDFIIDGTNIKLTENYLMYLKDKIIFTGLVNENLLSLEQKYGYKLISYLNDDFAIKNNYITVEGIIEAMVNNSPKAIFNSQILVIGYGRLGQITAKILKEMKAIVTVSARHEKDILHAKITDLNVLNNNQVINYLDNFDFIINTIPFKLLDNISLDKLIDKNVLIIDVASSPFGLDHEYAKKNKIKALLLPGIPGKIAPLTSGILLGEIIEKDLTGGGLNGR